MSEPTADQIEVDPTVQAVGGDPLSGTPWAEADSAPLPPVTVDVVMRMDPMSFRHADDLSVLSRQFAGWIVTNVTKMTEPKGADLFAAVVMHRGDQRAGWTYRDGHFVPEPDPDPDPDTSEVPAQPGGDT